MLVFVGHIKENSNQERTVVLSYLPNQKGVER
jgi:hypothetical protein